MGKPHPHLELIFNEILEERKRQDSMWGDQWLPGKTDKFVKLAILLEEVGEVAKDCNERDEVDPALRKELVEVGAICVAWLESISE